MNFGKKTADFKTLDVDGPKANKFLLKMHNGQSNLVESVKSYP